MVELCFCDNINEIYRIFSFLTKNFEIQLGKTSSGRHLIDLFRIYMILLCWYYKRLFFFKIKLLFFVHGKCIAKGVGGIAILIQFFFFNHLHYTFVIQKKVLGWPDHTSFCRPSGAVARKPGCCTIGPGFESRVRHGCETVRPLVYECLNSSALKNWYTGSAWFNSRSRQSTQPFGVFRGFFRNSRKYGLGFLRKIPVEGIPPIGLGLRETTGLNPYNQPTIHQEIIHIIHCFYFCLCIQYGKIK